MARQPFVVEYPGRLLNGDAAPAEVASVPAAAAVSGARVDRDGLLAERLLAALHPGRVVLRDLAARVAQRLGRLTKEPIEDVAVDARLLPKVLATVTRMEEHARGLADALGTLEEVREDGPLARAERRWEKHTEALASLRVSVEAGLQLEAAARARAEAGATERFQNDLSVGAAVLLVPALVAAVFDGSPPLSDSWADLVAMLVLMAVSAVGAHLALRAYQRRQRASRTR